MTEQDRRDPAARAQEISRRRLLSTGLKGAAGIAGVAVWMKPRVASTQVVAQVASVLGGGETRGNGGGEVSGAGGVAGGGGLANTGSDLWAALIAAGASIGAGGAAHYASKKTNKKKSRRRRSRSSATPPSDSGPEMT